MKQSVIISNKHDIYKLAHELPNNLKPLGGDLSAKNFWEIETGAPLPARYPTRKLEPAPNIPPPHGRSDIPTQHSVEPIPKIIPL